MKNVSTEGFVLKKRDYRESDEITTVFTRELGKIRIFSKGVRKITSRRSPHIQTGNYISCVLTIRNDLYFLKETTLHSGLSGIKQYEGSLNYLYQYFFILDRLLAEQEPEEEVYRTVISFCRELSLEKQFNQESLNQYTQRVLTILGYGFDNLEQDVLSYTEKIIQERLPLHVII